MALTIDDLFTVFDAETCKQRLLDRCAAKGLPISDWEPGSVGRTLIEIEAQENADFSAQQVNIARGAFLATSMADWLTLLAKDFFQVERIPASKYSFRMEIQNSGMNPATIESGKFWAANSAGLRFYLDTSEMPSYAIAVQECVLPPFIAEYPGSAYVDPPNTILTPIPGLTINGVDEVISHGSDAESDSALTNRCLQKWSTLNPLASNDDAIKYYCTYGDFSSIITRVKPVTSTSGSGICTVYVAGPSGSVGSGDLLNVYNFLKSKVGQANTINVVSATNLGLGVQANVRLKAGISKTTYDNAVAAALLKLTQSLDIGQPLYLSQIIECLMQPEGAISATLVTPSADLIPSSTQVVTYSSLATFTTYV